MSKTILHADDSPSIRRWVVEQLAELDVKVVSVSDGAEALQVLRDAKFDLLLTDLEMPKLDGLDLMAAIRKMSRYRFLPVLVLSTRRADEIAPTRRRGVTGWIVKPPPPEHLRRWVRRSLPG